jgi:hypothetical protein
MSRAEQSEFFEKVGYEAKGDYPVTVYYSAFTWREGEDGLRES